MGRQGLFKKCPCSLDELGRLGCQGKTKNQYQVLGSKVLLLLKTVKLYYACVWCSPPPQVVCLFSLACILNFSRLLRALANEI